ncbi:MAG TPA: OmpA family protein [Flavobacteriales bacterium]|nr:OmpA family protein [Flavobacteriales bacterium]
MRAARKHRMEWRHRLAAAAIMAMAAWAAQAQPVRYTTTDNKAIKAYEAGAECMRLRKWECAEANLKKAAMADPRFIEPRIYLGEMYEQRDMPQEAITMYREVVAISPSYFPPAALHLAELELRQGDHAAARKHFALAKEVDRDPQRRARATLGLANAEFAEHAMKQPVPFEPVNLGPGVNTKDPEYFPCITADDSTLILTRLILDERSAYGKQEDFFVSHRQADGTWGKAQPVASLNTADNEGAGTLTPDGRFIIFTKCAGPDGSYGKGFKGLGSCDLFISRKVGNRWTPAENLGAPVNSANWESQPSMGSDGRTLYFIRGTKRGGQGSTDIYVTRMGDDGTFSKPEKLGDNVNSPGREESVQIHPDGKTLYFSSDGRPGMGGLDIYMSRMQDDGTWGPAFNLGYPINTPGDENSLLVSADGRLAYFASDRPGGHGDLDLYSFELYPEARPTPVSYIKGRVTDKATGKAVEADVELYDLATGKLSTAAYSDPVTGEFLVCLPEGVDQALNASADGYLFYSRNYTFAEIQRGAPYQLEVKLSKPVAGEKIELRNIFFETASYQLLPASTMELDKLVRLLKGNPDMRIEVGGHTDNVGKDASNQVLSEQRANAVRNYLTEHGIGSERVSAEGYGAKQPVATNDTEQGRALNRRTEVTVL